MSLDTGSPASVVVSDKFGREIRSAAIGFDGTPVISNTFYDEHGRVERVEKPYLYGSTGSQLFTEFDYDELGRVILETAPGSIVTATEYLGPGTKDNVSPIINYQAGIEVTNSKSQTTTQYFDTLGRMIAAIDAADTVTRYAHDAHGNVTSIVVDNDASTEIASTGSPLISRTPMKEARMAEEVFDGNEKKILAGVQARSGRANRGSRGHDPEGGRGARDQSAVIEPLA